MSGRTFFLAIIAIKLCVLVQTPTFAQAEDLLCDKNGTYSLDRWQAYHNEPIDEISDVWQIRDGVLSCKGLPRGYV